jgi:hypothetical protein
VSPSRSCHKEHMDEEVSGPASHRQPSPSRGGVRWCARTCQPDNLLSQVSKLMVFRASVEGVALKALDQALESMSVCTRDAWHRMSIHIGKSGTCGNAILPQKSLQQMRALQQNHCAQHGSPCTVSCGTCGESRRVCKVAATTQAVDSRSGTDCNNIRSKLATHMQGSGLSPMLGWSCTCQSTDTIWSKHTIAAATSVAVAGSTLQHPSL